LITAKTCGLFVTGTQYTHQFSDHTITVIICGQTRVSRLSAWCFLCLFWNCCRFITGQMPFLSHNQHCQSTEEMASGMAYG